MSHLQKHLEHSSLLGPDQLDAALRRQQIYGGSLDTILLELELLDPVTLNETLGAATGHRTAPARLLRPRAHRPWDQIPPDILELGWASPLSLDEGILAVAVHPDLPGRELSRLQASVPGARLLVTAECVMARLAAERNGSVIPQRYAILSARFLQTLANAEDRASALPPPPRPGAPASGSATHPPMAMIRTDPDPGGRVATTGDSGADYEDLVQAGQEPSSQSNGASRNREFLEVGSNDSDAQELARTLASHRIALQGAQERDAVTASLYRAAMVLTPRVALFGVKHGDLVALETPDSNLSAIAGTTIPVEVGGILDQTLAGSATMDRVYDLDLRLAVGQESAIPCAVHVVRVRDRPVLMLYLDRDGDGFEPIENQNLAELCELAGVALEDVVKRRHRARVAGAPQAPGDSSDSLLGPSSGSTVVGGPRPNPIPPVSDDDEATDVNRLPNLVQDHNEHHGRTLIARKPLVSPPRFLSEEVTPVSLPLSDYESRDRVRDLGSAAQPDLGREPSDSAVHPLPSLTADAPLEPSTSHVPPPPPVGELDPESSEHRPTTLPGIPGPRASATRSGTLIQPSEVISLETPIHEGSSRGQISIEPDEPLPALDESHDALPSDPAEREADRVVIEAIERGGESVSQLRALGRPALLRVVNRFPGPLEVLRRDLSALPPPSAHGPLLRVVTGLGREIGPLLYELMDHPSDEIRFYAAFVFQELRDPGCVKSLSELAFDPQEEVRTIAMRVLETYSQAPGFSQAVASIRRQLVEEEVWDEQQQTFAAQAVGTLRDVHAIPSLIELLSAPDPSLRQIALESLCSITGQQHGIKPSRWESWYETHRHRHRIEWIIDSLRHKEVAVRRWAYDELVRITGHRVAHSPAGDKRSQAACVDAWVSWWESEGRYRFGQ